jgi:hypothetical protein
MSASQIPRSVRKSHLDQLCHDNAQEIGVPTILPASFPNSPRFYYNLYLDAVALPRRFGKPDLFVTMTCNPNWDDTHGADLYRQAMASCRNANAARTQLRAETTDCRVCAKFAAYLQHFL